MAEREQRVVELVIDARQVQAGTRQAEQALDHFGDRAAVAQAKYDALMERQQNVYRTDLPRSIDQVRNAYEKLQASIDPVFAAQLKAEREMVASLGKVRSAVRLGVTTEQEATATIARLKQQQVDAINRVRDAQQTADQTMMRPRHANDNLSRGPQAAQIAYQLQDIATTAPFMNPLTVALQQAPQLTDALGNNGVRGAIVGLGAAFASVLSPLSLLTVGIVAAGAAGIQYAVNVISGTKDADEAIRIHTRLIRDVEAAYGDAASGLSKYLQRSSEEIEAAARLDLKGATKQFQDELSGFVDSIVPSGGLFGRAAFDPQFEPFRKAITDLKESKVTIDEFRQAVEARVSLNPAWSDARDALFELGTKAFDADRNVTSANKVIELIGSKAQAQAAGVKELTSALRELSGIGLAPPSPSDQISAATNAGMRAASQLGPIEFEEQRRRILIAESLARQRIADQNPTLINSDGHLTTVPIPQQRPVTIGDPLPTFSRGGYGGTPYYSREVLLEEQQRQQLQGLTKGFLDTFSQSLLTNGGDIGDAFGKAILISAQNAMSQALDKLFNQLSELLVNAIMGPPSAGLMNKQIGFSQANTTLGAVLGAPGASTSPANDNAAGGFSGLAKVQTTDVAAYISQAARARGIDPETALRVARSEGGLNSWNMQSSVFKNGVQEPSFGPYQLYMGGGLGNEFQRRTGLDPRSAANGPAGVNFALDHASKNGWGAWYGAGKAGIGKWQGIGVNPGIDTATGAVDKLAGAAGAATKGLDTFGGGLDKIGQSLISAPFPAAPAAPSGGGGGLFGWLGSLFGGGGLNSALSASPQFASAWAKGGNGLYDRGGYTGHGGVNDPAGVVHRGEIVWSQADIARAGGIGAVEGMRLGFRGYDDGGVVGGRPSVAPIRSAEARPAANVKFEHQHSHSFDKNGNLQTMTRTIVREEAPGISRQVTADQMRQDRKDQERGGFGAVQQTYMKRKG